MSWSDRPRGMAPAGMLRLAGRATSTLFDRDGRIALAGLADGTCLDGARDGLKGKSVLVATSTQATAALAMIELDGVARRLTIAPPDIDAGHLAPIVEDAEVDWIVSDRDDHDDLGLSIVRAGRSIGPAAVVTRDVDTEWVMMTSGTSGRPKLVAHTLAALTGAIKGAPEGVAAPVWSTFYDIRRYGGLQIFLRAILGGADLVLTDREEPLVDLLRRLADRGVSAMSGTPSHWRRVLMSHERGAFAPAYIRLSGEIADQLVLDGLRAAFPAASIGHAYASTEAGVGFAVDDGLEGFPASLVDETAGDVAMAVIDGSLRIKSRRTASRYLGENAPALADDEGFIDTGDLVERRNGRYIFVGRRGGIINVGGLKVNPEEVEAAINSHAAVRMSLVRARKSPLTGALVVADVVVRDGGAGTDVLKQEILETCRANLDRHKVPVMIQFVPQLTLTPGGKLSRVQG